MYKEESQAIHQLFGWIYTKLVKTIRYIFAMAEQIQTYSQSTNHFDWSLWLFFYYLLGVHKLQSRFQFDKCIVLLCRRRIHACNQMLLSIIKLLIVFSSSPLVIISIVCHYIRFDNVRREKGPYSSSKNR